MTLRYLFLTLALLLTAALAHAQGDYEQLPSKQLKQQLRQKYLHSDTAQAIINLYGRRQGGGASWITGAVLAAVRIGIGSTSDNSGSPYAPRQENPGIGPALLVSAPLIAYGVSKLVRFSNRNLEQTLARYAAGQPLPPALRRKLKRRFFNQPVIPYTPVQYTPVQYAPVPAAAPAH